MFVFNFCDARLGGRLHACKAAAFRPELVNLFRCLLSVARLLVLQLSYPAGPESVGASISLHFNVDVTQRLDLHLVSFDGVFLLGGPLAL
jgi:hypothetical protein